MASVTLNWTDNSTNETGFRVQQRDDNGVSWTTIHTTAANATSYQVTGLDNDSEYTFRVGAVRGGVVSYSSPVTTTTAPAAPSDLQLTVVDDTQINLAWTNNATTATSLHVERSPDGSDWTEIAELGVVASYESTELSGDTTYHYRVRAKRGDVWSGYSNVASVVTAPDAPSDLTFDNETDDSIEIDWQVNSTTHDGFGIERSLNGVDNWEEVDFVASGPYTDEGLNDATRYYYRVYAIRNGPTVTSRYSAVADTWTLPAAPSGLSVNTPAHTQFALDLSWTDNSAGETAYEVQRSDDGSTGWTTLTDALPANTQSYQAVGLSHNTEYFFRVRAIGEGGPGAWSDVESGTTLFNPEVFADDNGAAMVSWLDFDDPNVLFQDTAAATPVTGSSQPIGRINDKISGAPFFSNGTTAQKPTFDGSKALFDGGDHLTSSDTNYWKFLHDGTRYVVMLRMNPTVATTTWQDILSNESSGAPQFRVFFDNRVSAILGMLMRNASATVLAANLGTSSAFSGSERTATIRYENGITGDDAIMRLDGTQVNSRETANTPSSSNPAVALRIGANPSTGNERFVGSIARIWIFTALADTDIPALETAIAS